MNHSATLGSAAAAAGSCRISPPAPSPAAASSHISHAAVSGCPSPYPSAHIPRAARSRSWQEGR